LRIIGVNLSHHGGEKDITGDKADREDEKKCPQ
jgi:hypothetical protein